MALTAGTELKRPDNYAVFETNCMKLGKVMIGATAMHKNGRRGQPQKGVDVWGWRNDNVEHIVGIQCKQKGFGQELEEKEVREEWEQALAFEPPIKEFYILTTADNDVKMEQLARELCLDLLRKTGRSVPFSVWGWGRICDELIDHPDLIKAFDPDYGIYSRQHSEKIDSVLDALARQKVQLDSLVAGARKSGGVVMLEGVDDASGDRGIDKVLDQQIDGYRSILQGGRPLTALPLFEKMLSDVEPTGSDRIVFRVKANIGACYIAVENIEEGCKFLLAAYERAPGEPKAISNRALAYLLLADFAKVLEIGEEQLSADIADESLWSHVVQAAAQQGFKGDPLSLVPERHRQSEGVLVAEVHFYRVGGDEDWRKKAAHAHALFPRSRYARQFFADSHMDQVGKAADSWATGAIPSPLRGHIEAAADTYADIWRESTSGEAAVGHDELVILANLLVALRLLDRYAEAIALIEKERAHIERDQGTLVRAAIAAYEGGSALADELLPLIEEGAAASTLKLQLALRRAEWGGIAEFDDALVDTVDEPEKLVCRTAIDMCRIWKAAEGFPAASDLEVPVAAAAGDPRASILAADMCMAFGARDAADKAWENGRRSITAASHWTSRISVAKHAFRRNRWRDAADLYLGAIDKNLDSEELRQLAKSVAYEIPQSGRGARFFRELAPALRKDQFFRHFEAVMLFNAGDMPRAEKATRAILKEVHRLDTFNLLAMTLQRSGRLDKIKDFLKSNDVRSFEGSPRDRMSAAQVLHQVGRIPEALKEMYRLYLAHRDRPDITLAFFGMMVHQRSFKHVPRPRSVGLDAWVRAEDDAGHPFTFVVGEDASVANGILPVTHAFVAQAMGKEVGQSFSLPRDVGGEIVWTIREIRHRWSQAARDIGQNFEAQFPNENGVYSYPMKDNDIQPMLDLVRQQAEANKQFAQQYADGLPLSFVSGRLHRDPVSFAKHVRSLGIEIRTCLGNSQERAQAFGVIESHRASGAVLDTYTAWTAATLDLLPALKELFGSLFIPQSVRDDLLLLKGLEKPTGKSFSIIYQDGQFLKHETSREEATQRRKYIEEQEQKIDASCETLAVSAPEITGDGAEERVEWLEVAVENFGSGVLDPAAIAANGYVLLSEDITYRVIANSIWPINSTWLQPAIASAARLGIITYDEFVNKVVILAKLRHGFVSIDHNILLKTLRGGDEAALADFKAAVDFIGTPTADVHSHIGVAIRFIDAAIARGSIPYLLRLKAISILLEKLVRNRPELYAKILVGVLVGCNDKGQAAVARWIQGHFMIPEVEDAHREFCRQTLTHAIRNIIGSDGSFVGNVQRLSASRPVRLPAAFSTHEK
ncbi:PIN domain-containing protein [Sinorhizobium fredii]|uniref:PIN domain-containing protein n=1 Tax=Rhizobium fredii TaxID=380 RepID=UPI00339B7AE0